MPLTMLSSLTFLNPSAIPLRSSKLFAPHVNVAPVALIDFSSLSFFTNIGHKVSIHTYALSKLSLIIPSIVFTSSAVMYMVRPSIMKSILPLTFICFTHAASNTEQATVDILPDSLNTESLTSIVSGRSRLYHVSLPLSILYALVSSPQAILTTVQSGFLFIKSLTSSSNTTLLATIPLLMAVSLLALLKS